MNGGTLFLENSINGSPEEGSANSDISYLDAVASGRNGEDCVATFHECPISLLSALKHIQDENAD